MANTSDPASRTFADRLNRLFETVHPHGRGPYSNEEVAQGIRARGGDISRAYLAYLRKGERTNPTLQHVAALASFFGVAPTYFIEDLPADDLDAQVELAAAMRDAGVRTVALRAAGLSPKGLRAITAMIERISELDGSATTTGAAAASRADQDD